MFYTGTTPTKHTWHSPNFDKTPEQPQFGSNTTWGNYILQTDNYNNIYVLDPVTAKIIQRLTISIVDYTFSFFIRDCACINNSLYLLIFDENTKQPYLALHNFEFQTLPDEVVPPLACTLIDLPYSPTNPIPRTVEHYDAKTFELLHTLPHKCLCYHPRFCSLSSFGNMLTFCYGLCSPETLVDDYPIHLAQFFAFIDVTGIFYNTMLVDDSYLDEYIIKRAHNTETFSGYTTAHTYHNSHYLLAQQHPNFSTSFFIFYFKDNAVVKHPSPYGLGHFDKDVTSLTPKGFSLFLTYAGRSYVSNLSYLGFRDEYMPDWFTLHSIDMGTVSHNKSNTRKIQLVNASPNTTYYDISLFTHSKALLVSRDKELFTQKIYIEDTIPPGSAITFYIKYESESLDSKCIVESLFIQAREIR